MNWLAHLLLAEPEPAFRIGALLPDLMLPCTVSGNASALPFCLQKRLANSLRMKENCGLISKIFPLLSGAA